jgi:undecaprenyl-diphosphatase
MNELLAQQLFTLTQNNAFLNGATFFFARYLSFFLLLGFLVFLLLEPGRRRRAFLFLEAILALLLSRGIITEGIRFFHEVQRPFEVWGAVPLVSEALGNSFPSGHAAFYFALATTLYFANKKWGLWFLLFAFLMGVARVAAGVHWPLDIVGGALIGIFSATLIHLLLKKPSQALTA